MARRVGSERAEKAVSRADISKISCYITSMLYNCSIIVKQEEQTGGIMHAAQAKPRRWTTTLQRSRLRFK